jgi:hypothetical protein
MTRTYVKKPSDTWSSNSLLLSGNHRRKRPLLTLFAANALVARSKATPGSRFLQIVDNFIFISSSFPKTSGTVKTLPKKAIYQVLSSAIQMRGGEKSYAASCVHRLLRSVMASFESLTTTKSRAQTQSWCTAEQPEFAYSAPRPVTFVLHSHQQVVEDKTILGSRSRKSGDGRAHKHKFTGTGGHCRTGRGPTCYWVLGL